MLGDDDRRPAGAEQAGDVGQRVGVVHVDDVGLLPRGRDVAGGDLLGAQGGEGEGAGDGGVLATRASGAPPTLHRDHLHLVAQIRRALGETLDHPFHAARARPVVLREVENAHRSHAKFTTTRDRSQPALALGVGRVSCHI